MKRGPTGDRVAEVVFVLLGLFLVLALAAGLQALLAQVGVPVPYLLAVLLAAMTVWLIVHLGNRP